MLWEIMSASSSQFEEMDCHLIQRMNLNFEAVTASGEISEIT
jgi:hypothetical protein